MARLVHTCKFFLFVARIARERDERFFFGFVFFFFCGGSFSEATASAAVAMGLALTWEEVGESLVLMQKKQAGLFSEGASELVQALSISSQVSSFS